LWRIGVFTDTLITDHNDLAWFCARANWRVFLHAHARSNKSVRVTAIANLQFLRKYWSAIALANWHISFSGNRGTKFAKTSRKAIRVWPYGLTVADTSASEFATHKRTAVSDRGYRAFTGTPSD